MIKLIDKSSLISKENKKVASDSLIFYCSDDKLAILSSNNYMAANFILDVDIEHFDPFAVDVNIFCNAFHNFPTDEVNFVIDSKSNSLIFGNKKTRVIVKTSSIDKIDDILIQFESNVKYSNLNKSNFTDCIKYTSFCCSSSIDEFPYSSILVYKDDDFFSAISSDKHRISKCGMDFDQQSSFLLNRNTAEILLNLIKDIDNLKYYLHKDKLIFSCDFGRIRINLDNNSNQNIFKKLIDFYTDQQDICKVKINKFILLKSLKFVSSVSDKDCIELKLLDNNIVICTPLSEKGMIADKIPIDDHVREVESSYLLSHLLKALDHIEQEFITLSFSRFNNYELLNLSNDKFDHLIFPMA